jgi:FAD-dependent oxidoreductase domain-containing protein 1
LTSHDVIIIGGSAMGSAAAYHLARLAPQLNVVVIEREPSYERSSTLRSDGNLRVQFNLEENIRMSLHTFELLSTFSDEMEMDGWRPNLDPTHRGNLFLTDADGADASRVGLQLQRSLGCEVEWLDADEIASRWPGYTPDPDAGIVGGTFGPKDGPIDPSALLFAFRRNAIRMGVVYLNDEATGIHVEDGRVAGVNTLGNGRLDAPIVINCAGAWAAPLAATAGVTIPVEPVMRTVFVVETPFAMTSLPNIMLPSGLYVFPDSPHTSQVAWSSAEDPVGFDFTFRRATFEETIWPELVRVLPAFDQLKITSGWCGLYAMNTFDHNAILGAWPEVAGLWLANGFSGHGFQHTPAMGRYLAERITGAPVTLDLSRLEPKRILDNTPVREHAGRII